MWILASDLTVWDEAELCLPGRVATVGLWVSMYARIRTLVFLCRRNKNAGMLHVIHKITAALFWGWCNWKVFVWNHSVLQLQVCNSTSNDSDVIILKEKWYSWPKNIFHYRKLLHGIWTNCSPPSLGTRVKGILLWHFWGLLHTEVVHFSKDLNGNWCSHQPEMCLCKDRSVNYSSGLCLGICETDCCAT